MPSAVIVPPEAVQAAGKDGVVFVIHDGTVERRAVHLGPLTPAGRIVLGGLAPGTPLAVRDFTALADGVGVRVEHEHKADGS